MKEEPSRLTFFFLTDGGGEGMGCHQPQVALTADTKRTKKCPPPHCSSWPACASSPVKVCVQLCHRLGFFWVRVVVVGVTGCACVLCMCMSWHQLVGPYYS